jgi:hypothetical protein
MSDEILNDDQLDAVAGGVTTVTISTKKANTAFATTVASDKASFTTPSAPKTVVGTAPTQALGSLRPGVKANNGR